MRKRKSFFISLCFQLQTAASFHKSCFNGGILCAHAFCAGNDNDIIAAFQIGCVQSVYLTKAAAHAVTDNSVAQLCRHGIAQTVYIGTIAAAIDNQIRGDGTLSLRVQSPEIAVLF